MRKKYSSSARSFFGLFIALSSVLLAGCELNPPSEEAREADRQRYGVSVMAVNLFNIMNMPESQDGVPWQTRYERIFKWMKDNQTFPDVIALQEAPGFWSCPTDARRLPDYAAIDFLLDGIREASGEQYRIAYLTAGKPGGASGTSWVGRAPAQFCSQQGDRALLYRPSRIRNVIDRPSGTQPVISPYVDPFPRQTYLAPSIQCCSPAADRADVCRLIDGPMHTPAPGHFELFMGTCSTPLGVAWKRERKSMQGEDLNKPRADAVFSRLELVSEPGNYIHIYNVHRGWGVDPAASSPADASGEGNINQLVADMEARFHSQDNPPLYPPILVGDFNKQTEFLGDMFPQFEIGMWGPPWPEVMGALFGKSDVFRSKFKAFANFQATIPKATVADDCYDRNTLISDHCGIFFRVEPFTREMKQE